MKALPKFAGCDLVFPAHRTGNARPVSGFSKVKVRLDTLCGVKEWVLHDLRRTTATAMAELGILPHVTEKILNHSSSKAAGPMAKIYQRYDYLNERRDALELWAETLWRITSTGKRNAVPLLAA
jgi:integrase